MQHSARLMFLVLVCSVAPTLRADLLGSISFTDFRAGGGSGDPPVLLALFSTIYPSSFPLLPGCTGGPFLPAPGFPCFSIIQDNLTPADVGKSFVIDESTNSDFATITSLLTNGSNLSNTGFTYPAGILPALPAAFAPPGFLIGGGTATSRPGIPNADITQLQFTLTSLCMSNNGSCLPGAGGDLGFTARLDVFGDPVPEPTTWLYIVMVVVLVGTRKLSSASLIGEGNLG